VANSGFAGVLWSPEVRAGTGEDMLRRIQAVCFSPLALFNGWATDTKLWTHADALDAIRDTILLRMRLLPYWYTAFAQYHFEGTPVVRPMPLVGGTTAGADVKDQYMIGDLLLVAPIAPGAKTRRVVLPPGRWYDFYTGQLAGERQTIEVSPPLSQIPLFVKDGGLVPLIDPRLHAPGPDEVLRLEVRHYGTAPGTMSLYDDDGETFAYERGERSWTRLDVSRDTGGAWHGHVTSAPGAAPWRYSEVIWVEMTR
jgi:alpha-D-xyloside xylohydrolase